MPCRCEEDGWARLTCFDQAHRRAMWVRINKKKIEFCAGREGDDSYAELTLGAKTTLGDLKNLLDVVQDAMYGLEQ